MSLIQNFDDVVSGIDIPAFLREHRATLRFPEMVSFHECVAYRTRLSWNRSLQAHPSHKKLLTPALAAHCTG
jgi:hypothetical protein